MTRVCHFLIVPTLHRNICDPYTHPQNVSSYIATPVLTPTIVNVEHLNENYRYCDLRIDTFIFRGKREKETRGKFELVKVGGNSRGNQGV